MTVQTNAGTVISVSVAAPATHDQAGFAALTFTAIGEIVTRFRIRHCRRRSSIA
jgi:hypothetical protein